VDDATISIRAALRPAEEEGILAVVADAFADDSRDASEELAIVRGTWAACDTGSLIELVADDAGVVVAHALAAPGRINGTRSVVAGVAPVCVARSHQGRALGTALMRALIAEAGARRWPLLVLLGEPAFYGRVGFGPAAAIGIHYPAVGRDNPHFLARPVSGDSTPSPGEFGYCWEAPEDLGR
jgi:putative acetyltransferase